jgi:hypothetical protein
MFIPYNSTPLTPNDHRSGKANIRLFIHIDLHRKEELYELQIFLQGVPKTISVLMQYNEMLLKQSAFS